MIRVPLKKLSLFMYASFSRKEGTQDYIKEHFSESGFFILLFFVLLGLQYYTT